MTNLKIGVILGGPSSEREISLRSGKAIAGALRNKGYSVVEIGETGSIEEGVLSSGIDAAFLALHGRYGEDGTVQQFLEEKGIPYTGSGPEASRLALDKEFSKELFISSNIPTPDYIVFNDGDTTDGLIEKINEKFFFPVVVKPALEGSSIGLSIVKEEKYFIGALKEACNYDKKIVIEQYIHGKEATVGILDNMPLEVVHIMPKKGYYNYEAKYTQGMTEYEVPAKFSEAIYKEIQRIGLLSHNALGCRDMSRVDFRVDPEGKLWVLEVNTIPGFTSTSLLPKAAQAAGISFDELCEKILKMAIKRGKEVNV